MWAVGALAEGLGIRAVARVFEVDPNTVLAWLIAVADHAVAFSQYFLHNVRVTQVQLDELFALLSAVKAGKISDTEAIQRLALAALGVDGDRPGEQVAGDRRRGAHPRDGATRRASGGPGPGPGCMPLFLTDGFKEYTTALLTHYGHWVQSSRRQATGPAPSRAGYPCPGSFMHR